MKQIFKRLIPILILASIVLVNACRSDFEDIIEPGIEQVTRPGELSGPATGFFLLNEANMGSNKASLDFMDFESGKFYRNIYPKLNPTVPRELGDVGNDIKIYGNKLYAVINCSHLLEVMDANTAEHLKMVSIPNCRYIAFDKQYAYISSYAGPVEINPNARLGYVARMDTATLTVIDTCVVGYQPEEMVIRDNKLYVANSGGYRVPDYDNTISVIDLKDFKEIKKIEVGINLHRMRLDSDGNIYVTSRGDYKKINSKTYIVNRDDVVERTFNLPASQLAVSGDSIYVYSVEWSHETEKNTVTYGIINTKMKSVVSRRFITDGTDKKIKIPYGLAIHPDTKEIFVTDAKDYVTPGTLYCFTPDGKKKWEVKTGDIPAHFVFTDRPLQSLWKLQPEKIKNK